MHTFVVLGFFHTKLPSQGIGLENVSGE